MQKKNILNILLLFQMAFLLILLNTCEKETPIALPILNTSPLTNLSSVSARGGGTILSDGGDIIKTSGVCWSTQYNPTIYDNFTSDGAGTGSFESNITGLTGGTHYYIRAYATNSEGTAYGNGIIFITPLTDIEGNTYSTAAIGEQVWMRENLKTTKFNDNTDIPIVTDNVAWITLNTPACSWYNNNESFRDNNYGVLYNWFTVNTGKLCPAGWHVPDEDEWTILVQYLGGEYRAGGKLKEQGTNHWINPNSGASDVYGFTALPGGFRTGLNPGSSRAMGYVGRWWVSTESANPWFASLDSVLMWARCSTIFFDGPVVVMGIGLKTNGYSIRCMKD
jgi:uncharacterized protein (TIGR02145 family)